MLTKLIPGIAAFSEHHPSHFSVATVPSNKISGHQNIPPPENKIFLNFFYIQEFVCIFKFLKRIIFHFFFSFHQKKRK